MRYKLYTTSKQAWDAMIAAIDNAQKSIFIEMYIFAADTAKRHDFIGHLKERARRGVKVVLVADAYGSSDLRKEVLENMRRAGIEVIFFSHWLRHIHRKILIFDEKVAFIGGVNIGKKYRNWIDLEIELAGRTVKRIMKSFAYTYAMAGGKNAHILNYRKRKFISRLRFWLLEHMPAKNIYALKSHYAEKITNAARSIQIVTPYFAPPRWLISLLDDAKRRNVKIEIIIPQKSDNDIISRFNYHYISKLHNLGIRFYLMKRMIHAKLLLIDGEEGLIGSQNIDQLSFHLNHEMGIFFREKKVVRELSQIFENWKRHSRIFEPKRFRMRAIDYLIYALIKIFHPIL